MAETFAPIVLPGLSQNCADVAPLLGPVPTMVEPSARLGALPPQALTPR